jgi:hypothetical protein
MFPRCSSSRARLLPIVVAPTAGACGHRSGRTETRLMLAKQVVDPVQILEHGNLMLPIGAQFGLDDHDPLFGTMKPLLDFLEDLEGQLLINVRHSSLWPGFVSASVVPASPALRIAPRPCHRVASGRRRLRLHRPFRSTPQAFASSIQRSRIIPICDVCESRHQHHFASSSKKVRSPDMSRARPLNPRLPDRLLDVIAAAKFTLGANMAEQGDSPQAASRNVRSRLGSRRV